MVLHAVCGQCKRNRHDSCTGFHPPPGETVNEKPPGGFLCSCDCQTAFEARENYDREIREGIRPHQQRPQRRRAAGK